MRKKLPSAINLLDPINPPEDIWTIMFNWVFKVGKYLLLIVEILVLSVFAARFTLDAQNNQLQKDINNIINSLSDTKTREQELKFRRIQDLLSDLTTIYNRRQLNSRKYLSVINTIPSVFTIQSVHISGNDVNIQLSSSSIEDVTKFETFLQQNPNYSDVKINILQEDTDKQSFIKVRISYTINS